MVDTVAASPLALAVRRLTVQYGSFRAVSGVDLDVRRGSVVGLIGPNGAGKTTCFNAICGYLRPSEGSVAVQGKAVRLNDPRSAWVAGIGRTFQKVELFWTLTVRDHIELARRLAIKVGRRPPSSGAIVDLLGLGELSERVVATLPLGTNRLVEVARAIATGANLILMDEPCSGLDHRETTSLKTALTQIQDELALSLLIVEHDMDFILSIAQTVYVLNHGSMIASGSPSEIRASEVVRRAYLGGSLTEGAEGTAAKVPAS